MKKIQYALYALIIAICFVSCAYTTTENEQLAALGIDFSYWLENKDDNTNRPLIEMGNGCVITIDVDANSAGDVVLRLDNLQLTESDIDLSAYTNSVFIHRIALLQYETRSGNININTTPYETVWQFWFYDDFRYMSVTDCDGNRVGPVFIIENSSEIKNLFIQEWEHFYITENQFEKVEEYLNTYIVGRNKEQMKTITRSGKIAIPDEEFPDDFIFNIDYSRLSVNCFTDAEEEKHFTVIGWMETGGVEYSFNLGIDNDENGNLIPDPDRTWVFVWEE